MTWLIKELNELGYISAYFDNLYKSYNKEKKENRKRFFHMDIFKYKFHNGELFDVINNKEIFYFHLMNNQ
jgi:hypothetical protein